MCRCRCVRIVRDLINSENNNNITNHLCRRLSLCIQRFWLPIKWRILYKLCLLMHLIHTNQRPAYMAEVVELTAASSSRSGLRSASQLLYRKPALKTKFGERAFSHASPVAWNSLPDYIQSESNTKHFKKLLKTYLFISSFYLFYCLSQHEMFAGLFCRWKISLNNDDDDDDDVDNDDWNRPNRLNDASSKMYAVYLPCTMQLNRHRKRPLSNNVTFNSIVQTWLKTCLFRVA